MDLRTITFWALYHPKRKEIIASRRFKYEIEKLHRPSGSVVVKMTGNYLPPNAIDSSANSKENP